MLINFPKLAHLHAEQRAFTLLEVIISVALVGGVLITVMTTVGSAQQGQLQISHTSQGKQLAVDLLNEILQYPYQEPYDLPAFGPEGMESTTSRALYDDIDDYHNWSASPPRYKNNTVIDGLDNWTRNVTVAWVEPSNINQTANYNTGVKKIVVEVYRYDKRIAQTSAVRTSAWKASIPDEPGTSGNAPPIAAINASQTVISKGTIVNFSALGSADPDGDPLTYEWAFEGTMNGAALNLRFDKKGTYTITLTVKDNRGGVDTDSITIIVQD